MREATSRLPEDGESLLVLTAGPVIWATHFLLCYVAAAVWCEKLAGAAGTLGLVRIAILAFTVVALAAIAAVGYRGWRRHRHGGRTAPHNEDSPVDRHRFLGFATLLLSGLSFVATVYVAMPALFMGTCR